MRANDLNFPYPVLGIPDSILGDQPVVRMTQHLPLKERIADPYRWEFDVELNNEDINRIVSEGKAEFVCEVMCSATLLRKCIRTQSSHIDVVLDRREVNKRVDFGLYVVTKERLASYTNAHAHEDYRELAPFDLAKGAPLAVLAFYKWDADLCYEDLTSLRSILQFVPNTANPREEFVQIDTEGPYIRVELPQAQYEAYTKIAGDAAVADVIHSSIVLYALQYALVAYSPDGNHRWERALEAMVSRDERFKSRDLELGDKESAPMIAMLLLNNPLKRLSESLPALLPNLAAFSVEKVSDDDGDEE